MMQRREIGRVVRVQVQLSSLKVGEAKARRYDPSPLREVGWLDLNREGVTATVNGETVVDVHNAIHPNSKNHSGINDVSIGFTSHYDRMRERFDAHLVNGIAGENVLVETDKSVTLDEVSAGILIVDDDGRRIEMTQVSVAHPCVEFSRFALDDLSAPPMQVSDALRFLEDGLRGYYASLESDQPVQIKPGDRVYAIAREETGRS
jgi:hypothetical protein